MFRILLAAVILILPAITVDAWDALPGDAVVLDDDLVWDVANRNSFAISPDGNLIAYISNGAILSCKVAGGPPTKLADLPDTITAYLALPGNEEVRERSASMPHTPSFVPERGLQTQLDLVFSLTWTPSQDGVVYTVRRRPQERSRLAAFHVMHASLGGNVTEITVMERDFTVYFDSETSFAVTADRKFVVASNYGVPLIWDAERHKPRATCLDYMISSQDRDRWLAVELDTRQLVLLDPSFEVERRFEVHFPQQRRCDLVWSPDERFAVCLSHRQHPSDRTVGLRINLETGEKTKLNKGVIRDQFLFTGNGGELIRLGIRGVPPHGHGDGSYGAYISILPDGDAPETEIVGFAGVPRESRSLRDRRPYPQIVASSGGMVFAMALPRPEGQEVGFHYHLIDRSGRSRPLTPIRDDSYISPYYPIAFTNDGQRLIARLGRQLFTVPVASIRPAEELINE